MNWKATFSVYGRERAHTLHGGNVNKGYHKCPLCGIAVIDKSSHLRKYHKMVSSQRQRYLNKFEAICKHQFKCFNAFSNFVL